MSDFGDMSLQERHEDLWDQLTVARRTITNLQDIVTDLLEQRADLLAALKGLVDWAETDTLNPEGTLQRRLMVANAAIARAEEEQP